MEQKRRLLALIMLSFVLLCINSLAAAATAAPLKLTAAVAGDSVTLSVVTTQAVTLSNYDVQLSWDSAAFTLTDAVNGQAALFSNFQKNVSTGKISAASGGDTGTVSAGSTLATYNLSASEATGGTYQFTLTVKDAANEDGDALAWKGSSVTGSATIGGGSEQPTSAPLTLSAVYDAEQKTVNVAVRTSETIVLSNYDVQLTWDTTAFTLSDITNGQTATFSNFQKNIGSGKVSVASGGSNVTVPAGATLATFILSVTSGASGEYVFTLTAKDAANEDGDALAWKGVSVQTQFTVTESSSVEIAGVSLDGAKVTVTASCSMDGVVLFCAAYKADGQYLAAKTVRMDKDGDEKTYILNFGATEFGYVKVFALNGGYQPLCPSVRKSSN